MAARALILTAGLGLVLALHGFAQAQDDSGRLLLLGDLYAEGANNTLSHACSQRFPGEAARWKESLSAWNARHAALLAEVRDLDAQLAAAVRSAADPQAHPTGEELLALRTQGAVWILGSLAATNDTQARDFCDQARGRLDRDDAQTLAGVGRARDMAREVLTRLRARSH